MVNQRPPPLTPFIHTQNTHHTTWQTERQRLLAAAKAAAEVRPSLLLPACIGSIYLPTIISLLACFPCTVLNVSVSDPPFRIRC